MAPMLGRSQPPMAVASDLAPMAHVVGIVAQDLISALERLRQEDRHKLKTGCLDFRVNSSLV